MFVVLYIIFFLPLIQSFFAQSFLKFHSPTLNSSFNSRIKSLHVLKSWRMREKRRAIIIKGAINTISTLLPCIAVELIKYLFFREEMQFETSIIFILLEFLATWCIILCIRGLKISARDYIVTKYMFTFWSSVQK